MRGVNFKGTSIMTVASALKVAVQAITLPIIGRAIGPHAYGQIALVSPFVFFAMMLAESGLGVCVVRSIKITKELEGTVFCFSAGVSLILMIIFAAISFPVGHLIHESMFPPLLISMSSILLIASFNIVPSALLLREQRYRWIALADIVSTLGGITVTVIGIALNWGIWSLVAQQIGFWLCKVLVVTIGANYRPRFYFNIQIIRDNFFAGSNLTGAAIFSFVARNIDNILIGAVLGSTALGFYAIAFQIVGMPLMVAAGSLYYTIFSSISNEHRIGRLTSAHVIEMLRVTILFCAPAAIGIAASAPIWIPLLLGDRWKPAIVLIALLTPLSICQTLGAPLSGVLTGLGRTEITFRMTAINSITTIVAILIGVNFGSFAVAIGVSLTAVLGLYFNLRAVLRECDIGLERVVRTVIGPFVSSIFMGLVVAVLVLIMPNNVWPVVQLSTVVVVGVLLYIGSLFILSRRQFLADVLAFQSVAFAKFRK